MTQQKQKTRCIVCNNTESFETYHRADGYEVVVCQRCSFTFIPSHYRTGVDYTQYKSEEVVSQVRVSNSWVKVQRNAHRFRLIRQYQKAGSVYDVGAGYGHFLLAGQRLGYETRGIEMNRASARYARSELDLDVEEGDFLKVPEDKKYDIVTFWDVLEHIDRADLAIAKAAAITRPGGYVFIQVPQIDSFFAKLLGGSWWEMGLDHVNYFSRETITKLLTQYGFQPRRFKGSIELKNVFGYVVLPWINQLTSGFGKGDGAEKNVDNVERQRVFNKITDLPKPVLQLLVTGHFVAFEILSYLGLTDEMIVVAERIEK